MEEAECAAAFACCHARLAGTGSAALTRRSFCLLYSEAGLVVQNASNRRILLLLLFTMPGGGLLHAHGYRVVSFSRLCALRICGCMPICICVFPYLSVILCLHCSVFFLLSVGVAFLSVHR